MTQLRMLAGLDRRGFLASTSGSLVSAVAGLGCGDDAGAALTDSDADGGAGSADTGPPEAEPNCDQTTAPNIEGPFFTPNSPERPNLRLAGDPGTLLRITGRVLSANCMPLGGALLDFWQADAAGDYDIAGSTYRGHQFADPEGRYELETIVPGRYLNGDTYRPAHIHVKAQGSGSALLTTQLYFPGDPYNAIDPFIDEALIMSVSEASAGLLLARFDFVLPPA